jgi:hypothetical protein
MTGLWLRQPQNSSNGLVADPMTLHERKTEFLISRTFIDLFTRGDEIQGNSAASAVTVLLAITFLHSASRRIGFETAQ